MAKRGPKPKQQSEPELEQPPIFAGDPDCFHLNTWVPVDRLDWIIGNLSHDDAIEALLNLSPPDKALALEFLIQRTIKRLVEPPSAGEMHSLSARLDAFAPHIPERIESYDAVENQA